MIIKSEIVQDYINGNSISKYKEEWFFKYDDYIFIEPSYKIEYRESVKRIFHEINKCLEAFIPCNVDIWNKLFSNWREIISNVTINLIVGYAEPCDATVLRDTYGEANIILDLGLWVKYEGKCDIKSVVHNLLTHELSHVCIGKSINGIDDSIESNDYLKNLDANTFHEAFAHLISFGDKNINEVQWYTEEWLEVKEKCKNIMSQVLIETDVDKQKKFLYDAVFGNYKEKYAAIAGMFYLVDAWTSKGIVALEEEFKKGYYGFAQKCANGFNNENLS